MILVFGKAISCSAVNLGCRGCTNRVDLKSFSSCVNAEQEADSVATFIFNTEDNID